MHLTKKRADGNLRTSFKQTIIICSIILQHLSEKFTAVKKL